jgi:hypothetical protein
MSHFDLNENPNLRQPYGVSAMKTFGCGPCKTGPITAQFSVNKQGFVPGEEIHFRVEYTNGSGRDLRQIEVTLWQNLIFLNIKNVNVKVASVLYPGVISESSPNIWKSLFIVPPVSPSFNGICKLIDTSYSVSLVISVEGSISDAKCSIPVVIGTIPLTNDDHDSSQSMSSREFSYEPSTFGPINPYELSIGIEKFQSDPTPYIPVYPYYKNLSKSK